MNHLKNVDVSKWKFERVVLSVPTMDSIIVLYDLDFENKQKLQWLENNIIKL